MIACSRAARRGRAGRDARVAGAQIIAERQLLTIDEGALHARGVA